MSCNRTGTTFNQSSFSSSASNVIKKNRTSSLTICSKGNSLGTYTMYIMKSCIEAQLLIAAFLQTCFRVSQLPANHSGIRIIPGVITDSTPLFTIAELHTTFIHSRGRSSNKSYVTIITEFWDRASMIIVGWVSICGLVIARNAQLQIYILKFLLQWFILCYIYMRVCSITCMFIFMNPSWYCYSLKCLSSI